MLQAGVNEPLESAQWLVHFDINVHAPKAGDGKIHATLADTHFEISRDVSLNAGDNTVSFSLLVDNMKLW